MWLQVHIWPRNWRKVSNAPALEIRLNSSTSFGIQLASHPDPALTGRVHRPYCPCSSCPCRGTAKESLCIDPAGWTPVWRHSPPGWSRMWVRYGRTRLIRPRCFRHTNGLDDSGLITRKCQEKKRSRIFSNSRLLYAYKQTKPLTVPCGQCQTISLLSGPQGLPFFFLFFSTSFWQKKKKTRN